MSRLIINWTSHQNNIMISQDYVKKFRWIPQSFAINQITRNIWPSKEFLLAQWTSFKTLSALSSSDKSFIVYKISLIIPKLDKIWFAWNNNGNERTQLSHSLGLSWERNEWYHISMGIGHQPGHGRWPHSQTGWPGHHMPHISQPSQHEDINHAAR